MKKFLLLIALIISGLGLNAQSVGSSSIVYYDGYSLKFTVTKLDPAECKVVCDTKPTTPGAVSIPSSVTIEGSTFSVTSIGNDAFSRCSGLTSIEIPNSVTSIGRSAFSNCSGLTSIEIPNSVTSIGNSAFSSCDGLTSIEIPNSVTSIGNSAFSSCDGLESFVVEGGNPNYDSRNNCNAIIETQTNTLLYGCMNTIIPNSVTSIRDWAFYSCSGLTSIEIPNSVTSIGNYAFESCSGLTSIEIPNSVTSIGIEAFSSCDGLESFVVEGGNPNYDSRNNCNAIIETQTNTLLYGCMNTIIPNSVTSIGDYAFYNCDGLTSIEIPNSVTSIGNDAFSLCDGLESFVVEGGNTVYDSRDNCNAIIETQTNTLLYGCMNTIIPNSVTSIGNYAFYSCYGLTSIEIPNSVTSIGNFAFSDCSGLTSIEIPNSVTSIGNFAFESCSHLRSIKCHAVDVPVTATDAFYNCPEDMTIQVPEESVALYQAAEPWKNYNVTEIHLYQIGDYVVVDYEGYSLRYTIINVEPAECEVICETKPTTEISITIPSSVEIEGVVCNVTKIGNEAFYSCDYLTSIEIPNSVTSIGNLAFASCSGLTSIEIPNSVTSIVNFAFYSCDGLTSIEIPNSVTSIGESAFSYCSGLTSIEIPNSVTSIGNEAFSYCDGLESIVVESGNTVYDSRNNCNAIIETSTNTLHSGCMNTIIPNSVTSIGDFAFVYCNGLTSIEIPNSVTSIGNYAFCFCSGLTSIEIPNSVTSIGNCAFCYSGLTSIEIPNSVTSIGYAAFSDCDGLTSIEIPNSVTSIGESAFSNCSGLTSIEIPNSVTSIGNEAFYNCSGLTSIEIPNSVTSIGNFAFYSCSHLRSIKCHAVDVPVTATDAFNNCPEDMTIQVPEESVALYQAVEPWKNYNVTEIHLYQIGDYVVVDYEGYSLRYTIINVEPAECEVICETKPTTEISITIPSSVEIEGVVCNVTKIGNSAFYSCSGLTSIEIPNSVTSIGNFAFYSCSGLTSIEIPNSVTSIGNSAFSYCFGLTSIEIPNSVTSIGNYAFSNCSGLTSIEIPNSVTSIGNEAFSPCDGLESFVVEGGNPNYDSRDNCNAIIETQTNTLLYGCMNTIIPNSVTSIGNYAFSNCYGLTSIEIPNSVNSIGERAFYSCSHLRSIKCHAVDVPVTATDAFNNCPEDMTIQVPEESVASYQAAEPWKNYNVTEIHLYQIGDYVVVDYEGYSLRYTIINVEHAECKVICDTEPTTPGAVSIPSSVTIEGSTFSVTSIGNYAFSYFSGLTSIEIPNSVTSIGNSAFSNCFGLTSIEIPNSVTSIGNFAFYFCSGLTSIEIPNSVTSIGNYAFSSCDGLESFVVEGGNPNYDSRNNCNAIIETQTNTLLYGCMNTIIPNSVTSIGRSAFEYCSGLTSIEIPNSVTSIGESAFIFCSKLTSIEIPNSVTSIGNSAFVYCSGLTSIEIPNSVTSIGIEAFSYCYGLESFVVESGNTVYDSRNNCNAIIETSTNTLHSGCMNTIIPNSVTSIGNSAFVYCSGLTSIEIPNSVTSIGYAAFSDCDGLTSIEIPNSVTSIGNEAFSYCDGLESFVVEGGNPNYDSRNNCNAIIETQTNTLLYGCMNTIIPNSVTSIGNEAFVYCNGLTSIEIPNSVTSIGNYAFNSCSHLRSIKCHAVDVPVTATDAFDNCPEDMTIQVPEESVALYQAAQPWSNYNVTKMYPYQNGDYVVVDYEGYSLRYTIIKLEPAECEVICETKPTTEISITIPSSVEIEGVECSVTKIGNFAFDSCDGLTSIEIPNSVTSIGNFAFYNCDGLTSIEIPNSVTSIGNYAFSFCDGLTSIEIPNSVTSIGNEAFSYCDGLESFVVEGGNPNYDSRNNCNAIIETQTNTLLYGCMNTIIPNSVTSIGNFAFEYCSGLTSIEIPNSVTSIGESAFLSCSHLRSIKCHAVDVPVTATDAFDNCPEDMTIQVPEESVALYQAAEPWKNYNVTEIHLYQIGDYVVVDYEGYSLRYTIIKLEPAECEVICETKPTTKVSITIPSSVEIEGVVCSVTSIGNYAFNFCDYLASIEIPNSVTSIGERAFYSCDGLTSIEIPNSVTSIGNSAFSRCFGLTSIEIPNSVTSIGEGAFSYCDGLTSIEIPNSVTSIGRSAFYSCSSLERIVVENGNTVYDSRDNCNAIIETQTNTLLDGCMNTIIPNSVTSIGYAAFSDCDGLTSIEIPNSVTSIGNLAFSNCFGLTSIEIPNSVTSIGNLAFSNCFGLTSIEIPNSVTSIGNEAFSYCVGLESFVVESGNPNYDSRNNCNAIIETQTNTLLYGCMNTIIPNSVTSIGDRAFSNCSGLTSIEIPNSVTSIGNYAFSSCSHLRSIKCHAVDVPVTAINAFNNCPEDMTIQVPEESVASYQAAEPWKNYNIVAGFNSTINLTSNIEEGGFVEGSGNYQDGTEITVYAYVNPNYGFLYWSENDEIVSYSPEYTFTVSNDRNLTANFAINHWIPDYTIYPNTMAVVGVVQIDGIEQNSSNIEIGAFCGNELRGSNRLFYESKYDRYYLYLTIYGKDDDEISFKIYDHTIESELKLYYNETINFSINDNIGSSTNPMIFNFTTEFLHKRQLSSNWNWYSTFVAVEGRNGFVMLTEGLGELGIQVKSQFAFSNYETGDWNGALKTVNTENMYMIKMSEPTELSMSGIIVEPSEFPIVLNPNWKWIPYSVSVPMDVTTAFAEFTPHDGDIVKSQEGFTQYYEGLGWSGSLNTMTPGEGYMYQNTSGEEKTLYYPTTGEAKGETKTNITSENNYWKPEVSKYPTNMSVIAAVDHSDELDFEVAAFSNGECRGSARPIYIDGLDKNILFLTIYGEDNETITFRYYDANSGEEYNISNRIIYSTDSTIGNVKEPYVINLIPANVNEITENEVCIYPNPVNTNSEIHLTTECDRVEVYNSLGVKISEHENVDRIDGIEVSGVYIIKVVKEGVIKYNRIVVK